MLMLLLSDQKASELSTVEGKKKLAAEIIAAVNQPFVPNGTPQNVNDVFFTSFAILSGNASASEPNPNSTSNVPRTQPLYFLQAGAFRNMADAEDSVARLNQAGFKANILAQQSISHLPLYLVRLGPFSQLDETNYARNQLSDSGINVAVVVTQKIVERGMPD